MFIAVIYFPVIDLNEHINTILYLLCNFSDVYAWFRPRAVTLFVEKSFITAKDTDVGKRDMHISSTNTNGLYY